MGDKIPVISKKITLAFFTLIIALTITVCTPVIARAENRSNHPNSISDQDLKTSVKISMALLAKVITGNEPSGNSKANLLSSDEDEMISLINQERAKAGLKELELDLSLVKLAHQKSQDMVTHNYFGHNSKTLGSIYQQLEREKICYQIVGENLAGAGSGEKAQEYFIDSPAHRNNIFNPHYTKIGVGIVRGGPYGMFITQLFLG